jgi:uncharacterized membrane protein
MLELVSWFGLIGGNMGIIFAAMVFILVVMVFLIAAFYLLGRIFNSWKKLGDKND